jgi:hypothetical protein
LNVNDPATANVVESLAKKLIAGLVADDGLSFFKRLFCEYIFMFFKTTIIIDKTPQREQHLLEV